MLTQSDTVFHVSCVGLAAAHAAARPAHASCTRPCRPHYLHCSGRGLAGCMGKRTLKSIVGDFVAQPPHCFFSQAKLTPKLFIWHVKRILGLPSPTSVPIVRHLQKGKRRGEGCWHSTNRHVCYSVGRRGHSLAVPCFDGTNSVYFCFA